MNLDQSNRETSLSETVVLIHGWFSHSWLMHPLAVRFKRAGYLTRIWSYPSLRSNIESHADELSNYLNRMVESEGVTQFSIVAHSMGSIVTRCALQRSQIPGLARVVMLCPPNQGSHVATAVSRVIGARLQTLDQITDRPDSFVNQLSKSLDVEVGIVSARGDRVIRNGATLLDEFQDHVEVPGMHTMVLFRKLAADLCIQFLKTGKFKHYVE
jgi:pimeloyl-ACP methyl ester carboxylesterase